MTTTARRRAARIWAFRSRVEHQAALRFGRLSEELLRLDADPTVVGLARRAASDERRHQQLCASLALELGAERSEVEELHAVDEGAAPPAVTLGRRCPRERLLAEVVAMSCVTESLSAALLAEMRWQARDPRVREVVHEVLRDEIDHARLGWAHLAAEAGRRDVGWLAPHMPAMLAATVHEELFEEPARDDAIAVEVEVEVEVEGLGSLRRSSRREIFVGTMEAVVLPGLERFGVDPAPAHAWLRRQLGSAQGLRPQLLGEVGQRLGQR